MQEKLLKKFAANIDKHLEKLAKISTDENGVTRLPFTEQAREAAAYIANYMSDAGLTVQEDAAGAVIGTLKGKSEKKIVIGSHYDSVKNGGKYDGIAGVVCGVEIAHLACEKKLQLPYTLQIVATNDEEGVRFGDGFLSAKAFLGQWQPKDLKERCDDKGISIYEAMQQYGLNPEKITDAAWNKELIRAFIEIHIEQGPVLEKNNKELGIVTQIVGMRRYKINIKGRADHAGTTPMSMRQDALLAASQAIAQAPELSLARENTVATVGYCQVYPNAVNTIAENVIFQLDIRSTNEAYLSAMEAEFKKILDDIAAKCDISYDIDTVLQVTPVAMDEYLQNIMLKSAAKRNYTTMPIYSGAGHDSLPIGRELPVAMLFVPSEQGRSHSPQEKSSVDDLAKAVLTIFDSMQTIN